MTLAEKVQEAVDYLKGRPAQWNADVAAAVNSFNSQAEGDRVTYYVNKSTGNDNNVGSSASPFRTIERAVYMGRRVRNIQVNLLSNYLVSKNENMRQHPGVCINLQGHQLQFRRMKIDVADQNPHYVVAADVAARDGVGYGLFRLYNVGGLKINSNGSNIIVPRCYATNAGTGNYAWNIRVNSQAIQLPNADSAYTFNPLQVYIYASDIPQPPTIPGTRVHFVDTSMQTALPGLARIFGFLGEYKYAYLDGYPWFRCMGTMFQYLKKDANGGNILYQETQPTQASFAVPFDNGIVSPFVSVSSHSHGIQLIQNATFPALVDLETQADQL
jgi:hypothetical protein